MELQYRHVENALVPLFGIDESCMAAFKARIRHLRNLGVPDIAKPGSGDRVAYSVENAAELVLAIELERLGKPPRKAALLASHFGRAPEFLAARTVPRFLVTLPAPLESESIGEEASCKGSSSYLELPDGEIAILIDGPKEMRSLLKNCRSIGVINLSELLTGLEKYLSSA